MNDILHEEALKELNLHPVWQLRTVPVRAESGMSEFNPVKVVGKVQQAMQDKPVRLELPGLEREVASCQACELRAGCLQTVFGAGDVKADWMFLGAWPTEDDESTGIPFSGPAGQLLDNMLASIQLKRDSKVYLSTVVKCCGEIRRGPRRSQIDQCIPFLAQQIRLIRPKLIVLLGHAAATAVMGEDHPWEFLAGREHVFEYQDGDGGDKIAVPMLVTYHPAALLLTPQEKARAWQHLCMARKWMKKLQS